MKYDQKVVDNQSERSPTHSARIPSCLWFLLGGGAAALLIGLGLLLAWMPTLRTLSNQEGQVVETSIQTLTPSPDFTSTPYIGPDSPTSSPATPTPPTGKDYLEGGADPTLLLLITPSARSGFLTLSPYLNADAGNFQLEPGLPVTFRWDDFPPGALRYHFILNPHAGEEKITIAIDDDPADGVEVMWTVPENIAGDLHAFAIYENGQVTTTEFSNALYSGSSNGSSTAENVLTEYFRTLSAGEYRAAADLYGGDYSILQQNNPDLSPEDRAGLFQRACQQNGFVCLPVHELLSIEPRGDSAFAITVNFMTEGGILLTQDGCCGETPSENPLTAFTFLVAKDSRDHFLVMDLPVYIP